MADTLKPSDNLYADSLFLHAAAKLEGKPVNWKDAQSSIKKFLQQQTGINLQQSVLVDGSGLSRYDLLTPAQTVSLLNFLFYRFPLSYEYIAALPISGRDGTLQKRLKKPHQQDLVRAKTGTMTGVVSLSGYLYTANAHTLAFAIFINNSPSTKPAVSGKSRYLVDALCAYFLQQKPLNSIGTALFGDKRRIRYQLNPPQAEVQRSEQAKWRRLETAVKQALKGQDVSVVYRSHELVLEDKQPDGGAVMRALQSVYRKYPFAAMLSSKSIHMSLAKPVVFWTEEPTLPSTVQRLWVIRESANS
jgi:D-alanyl-D-alanine carboxypeptidase/D-alanyl-D-alanine-endopeptidase (penicillin-binding protein 4)